MPLTVVPGSVVKPYPKDDDPLKAHEFHVTLSDGKVYDCGGFVPRAINGLTRQVILIRTPNGLEDGPLLLEAIAEEYKALGAAVPDVVDPTEDLTAVPVAAVDGAKSLLDRIKSGDVPSHDEIAAVLTTITDPQPTP